MSDVLKSNPIALRHCILFEVLQGTPIEETYRKFCRTLGNDFMEYREFDFWYYRFLNGEYDLNYERDKDKKIHELSNMPIDVMEEIVEHLDIFDRLIVRNLSRDLRALIDKRANCVKQIEFSIQSWRNTFSISIDNVTTNYVESRKPKTSKSYTSCYNNDCQGSHLTFIEGPGAMKNSLIHLAHYLKNTNLKLKFLAIGVCTADKATGYQSYHDNWCIVDGCYTKLEPFLLSLKHQISTEGFKFSHVSDYRFLMALKSLKPGVLKSIGGEIHWNKMGVINEIVGTEQWKQAKRLIMWGGMPTLIDEVAHFEVFSMNWNDAEAENVVRLKEVLFKSPNFENCCLTVYGDIDFLIFDQEFGDALPERPYIYHYPIPSSTDYFEIEVIEFGVQAWSIRMTRKK